jgi:DNA-directed RNA polymerase specialized sigma24 family protein
VSSRDEEYTEYVAARMMSLRRVAFMLCQDWHRADDLVQGAITQLYLHWGRARAAEHIDAYARRALDPQPAGGAGPGAGPAAGQGNGRKASHG